MADISGMLAAMDAALVQGSASAAPPRKRTAADTIAALDVALAAGSKSDQPFSALIPGAAPTLSADVSMPTGGSASVVPAGMSPLSPGQAMATKSKSRLISYEEATGTDTPPRIPVEGIAHATPRSASRVISYEEATAPDRPEFGGRLFTAGNPAPVAKPSGDGAANALNAVEGTGRENYDAGPAEDGLTPGQRAAGIPGLGVNMLIQAAKGVPLAGAAVDPLAARLASAFNGRSVAENEDTGREISDDFTAAHPALTVGSRVAGGIIGMAPLIAAAPEAFGLGAGPLLARGTAAVGSNAALSGADAAVRGEDVGKQDQGEGHEARDDRPPTCACPRLPI